MITLGNETGGHVTIGPIGRISPDGWFQSSVEITVNGFEGHIRPYFEMQDFLRFHNQSVELYENLKGVAELKPIEGQFGFTLTGDGKGHIKVCGIAYTQATYGSCLRFEFEIDQTHLPKLIRSTQKLLEEYASRA